MLIAPAHVRRDAPQQEAPHDAGRRRPQVAAPEHVARVDDHERQAARRDAQRLGLRGVLGLGVGHAEPEREGRALGHRAVRLRRPDGADRGRVDGALDAGAQRLLHHQPRALHVHAHAARPAWPAGASSRPRGTRARRRAAHAAARPGRPASPSRGSTSRPASVRARRATAHRDAHGVAARHERPRDVRSHEPGRSGHERSAHGPIIAAPPRWGLGFPPMADPVAVVTDSTHYMPPRSTERHGLHTVSLYVTQDGETVRESEISGLRRLLRADALGARAADDVAAVGRRLPRGLRAADRAGRDIVSIHLSGGISGTVRSAEQAREQLIERGVAPERMLVVDSATTCAGHGLMAVAAANAAAGGASAAEAVERARALRRTSRSSSPSTRSSSCAAAGASAARRRGSARR